MNYENIINTIKDYCKLNNKLDYNFNNFINSYTKEDIEKIIKDNKISSDNEEIEKMCNFLFGIESEKTKDFSVNFYYSTNVVSMNKESYIEIKSNYINFKYLIEKLFCLYKYFTFKGKNNQIVLLDSKLDLSSFYLTKERISLDENDFSEKYSKSIVRVYGSDSNLESLYDFLQQYFEPLFEYNKKYKIYTQIINGLYFWDSSLLENSIDNLVPNKSKLESLGYVNKIEELKKINLLNVCYEDLVYIYENLINVDLNSPHYYFSIILGRLTPKEEKIFNLRFNKDLTLEEVGNKFSLTRERIRQYEKNAFERIKSNKKIYKLYNSCKLYITQKNFFTKKEFEKYNIPFLAIKKIFPDLFNYSLFDYFYFSNYQKQENLKQFFESLPDILEEKKLTEYIENYFGDEIYDGEKEVLIKCIYDNRYKYGDYLSNKRLFHTNIVIMIMKEFFPLGIAIGNDFELEKVRKYAIDKYNYQLSEESRALKSIIQRTCVVAKRGIWVYNEHKIELSKELDTLIMNFIKKYNSKSVPIIGIYNSFEEKFNEIGIMNKYSLQDVLKRKYKDKYIITRDYIHESKNSSLYDDVALYIYNSEHIVTAEELKEYFPGVNSIILQNIVSKTDILNMNDYYVSIKSLSITLEEEKFLYSLVYANINDNSQHHSKFIFEKIKFKMNGLFNRIGLNHYLQFYYLVEKLFKDKFSFQRPYISLKNVVLLNGEVLFLKKVLAYDELEIKYLRDLASSMGYYLDGYITFVKKNIDKLIFKNNFTIINCESLKLYKFNKDIFDRILDDFIGQKEFKPFYLFTEYWRLPDIGIEWNEWVLYSMVFKYSQKYSVATTTNILKEAIPVLVIRNRRLDIKECDDIKSHKIDGAELENLLDLYDLE